MTGERVERLRRNHRDEIDSAALYDAMASAEREERLAGVYREPGRRRAAARRALGRPARAARRRPPPSPAESPRAGPRLARVALRRVAAAADAGRPRAARPRRYTIQPEAPDALREEERAHARLLQELHAQSPAGRAAEALARTERRRVGLGGNALRAAVLGANDGLVSNLSLVMGVAGAELSSRTILVTGIAGLLAGALSMAMGEWISVQSSRELYAHQIEVERLEIATMPELETEELALIYRAKGVPAAEARALAERIMGDEDDRARRDGPRGARHRPRGAGRLGRRRRGGLVRALHARGGGARRALRVPLRHRGDGDERRRERGRPVRPGRPRSPCSPTAASCARGSGSWSSASPPPP